MIKTKAAQTQVRWLCQFMASVPGCGSPPIYLNFLTNETIGKFQRLVHPKVQNADTKTYFIPLFCIHLVWLTKTRKYSHCAALALRN